MHKDINKGWERVPVKFVVHFDNLILLVYSVCLQTWKTSRVMETLSY